MNNRREFITKSVRWLLLGGLLAGMAALLRRPHSHAPCAAPAACQSCGRLPSCSEPQAEQIREHEHKHEHEHTEAGHGKE